MSISRFVPITLLAVAGSASAIDHVGESPATHMELKDGSGTVVCFAYDTDPAAAPIATGCPEGPHLEQLFDDAWNRIGQRSVFIGDDSPAVAPRPVRVERSCVWDEVFIRESLGGISEGENFHPFCTITCPEGVVIDTEASGSVPGLEFTADPVREKLSYSEGTGEESVRIFVVSRIPLDVAFDRFDVPDVEGFEGLTYVIEAAAVCL